MPEESRSEKARRKGPPTFDHLRKRQPMTKRVPVYLDDDVAAEAAEVNQRAARWRIRHDNQPLPEELQQEVDRVNEELKEHTTYMVFQSMGRKAYEDLMGEHPPTKKQEEEAEEAGVEKPPYNTDTFPPALISASCVEPEMSVAEVEVLFDEWTAPEITAMFSAALEVNTQRRVVQMGEG